MRIAEISPELVTGATAEPQPHILIQELESLVKLAEALSPNDSSAAQSLAGNLRKSASRLTSGLPLPESSKLQIWKLSYRLWNACVDLSNAVHIRSDGSRAVEEHHAMLRQVSADLVFLAGNPAGIPSPAIKAASFFYKTGMIWHDLKRFDLAAGCFERATDLTSTIQLDRNSDGEEKQLLLDLNLARSRTAWEASDRSLAIALLNRSKNILFGSPASYRTLAEQYLHFGKLELSKNQKPEASSKLLNEALNLCEKGIGVSRRPDEALILENLKARCLRFLAAERLQAEDYEGVLKCVRVLREGGEKEEHPTVGFVSLRAWLGLGRVAEAERELKTMVANKGVPETICVAAAEAYLAVAGAEAAKGVLMGLVGRCRLGASSALRVVQRVVEGGGGGRARVVAELVSHERVVALFAGSGAAKDLGAMHAILWNCGAEHFRLKDYETAAELFEKSMLYLAHGEENRSRRANCHRVLCLCHLGLSQLDRAQEFIDEADKLEPNINCAFFKFKIYLQKEAEKEAINQIPIMVNCIDFNPEYLTLATHEAIACQSVRVAIASLSALLNLCSPGKTMPMTEVAILRNLITLLCQTSDSEPEIIKYMRRARARMSEVGAETFFGKGAVGICELNWFAGNSWNMGLKAGKEKNFESSMEFMELASEFYGANVDKEPGVNHAMVCKALILSVATMLGSMEKSKIALTDTDITKALGKLDKASKILTSTSSTQIDGDQPAIEPSIYFLHTFCAYQLIGRHDDEPHSKQLQLIKNYASSSKSCSLQNLLQLGLFTTQGTNLNLEAADFVLSACLSSLLASPMPDYQTISLVLRKLAVLSGHRKGGTDTDDDAHGVYLQAYRIIVGLKDGEYPTDEGKWLAMTAWNKSGSAIRLGQVEVARKWMKTGLDLARHLPGMNSYLGGMEECVASFEKNCNGSIDNTESK